MNESQTNVLNENDEKKYYNNINIVLTRWLFTPRKAFYMYISLFLIPILFGLVVVPDTSKYLIYFNILSPLFIWIKMMEIIRNYKPNLIQYQMRELCVCEHEKYSIQDEDYTSNMFLFLCWFLMIITIPASGILFLGIYFVIYTVAADKIIGNTQRFYKLLSKKMNDRIV